MREVDQALARAYGQTSTGRAAPTEPSVTPPPPHFSVEPSPASSSQPGTSLKWPATVRALEREHRHDDGQTCDPETTRP